MNPKFKDPSKHILFTPVDWFNFYGSFEDIFSQLKSFNMKSPTEACLLNPATPTAGDLNHPTFILTPHGLVDVVKENAYDLAVGAVVSKFMILAAVKFKSNTQAAASYIQFDLMKSEIPYMRVGTDYFKLTPKTDRYGGRQYALKGWNKETITDDHSKNLLQLINKYDDFTILPNNKEFIPVQDGCYNLYSRFAHQPCTTPTVTTADIPVTFGMLKHIFGDQLETGLKYMKVLYEHPRQILPVLALVSDERDTGKTTFLNWISMLFGNNSVIISPEDLSSHFNSGYATHNIIMIDETVIEKSATGEKLKSLATAKTISVSQKFVQAYSVPFFGKIIFCTNKVKDFMRIDKQEIRFWVRRIGTITGDKNTAIEEDLFKEIPAFLKYLCDMPPIDFTKSRMVFTVAEIDTDDLQAVKRESKSALHKELEMLIDVFFNNNPDLKQFHASAFNIKEKWFAHNNQISIHYISKVLKEEIGMTASPPRYDTPFADGITRFSGRYFTFLNPYTT